jgi:clan AA aspartic protease (TIGR02281 family)
MRGGPSQGRGHHATVTVPRAPAPPGPSAPVMSLAGGSGSRAGTYLLIAGGVALLGGLLLLLLPGSVAGLAGDALLVYILAAALLLVFALLRDAAPVLKWAVRLVLIWVGVGLLLYYGFQQGEPPGKLAGDAPASLPGNAVHVVGDPSPAPGPASASAGASASGPTESGLPPLSSPTGDGQSLRLAISPDGHFRVQGSVGATAVLFLVDTGASNVLLSPADARRMGYNPAGLSYTQIYRTADGEARAAPLVLPEIDLGPIRVSNVTASVFEHETSASLLGMSFLSRLSGYEVTGNILTLHQ